MTLEERVNSHERQLEMLTQIAASALESIKRLESTAVAQQASTEAQQASIEAHQGRIEALDTAVRTVVDEIQGLTREWQAYLRRLPPQ